MNKVEILDEEIPKKSKSLFRHSTLLCNLSFVICLALQILEWRQLPSWVPIMVITVTILLYLYGYIGLIATAKWNGFIKGLISAIILLVFTLAGTYVLSLFITILSFTISFP